MYAEERQRHIAVAARAAGRVDVAELSVELEVTTETIRRDLSVLERHGILRRVHGGAIPVERLGFEPALPTRNTAMTTEKDRIAKAALAELPDEGAILLDAGTTTARLAELLPPDRPLTVLTNSLPIALALVARPYLTVMLVGGRVRGRSSRAAAAWMGSRGPLLGLPGRRRGRDAADTWRSAVGRGGRGERVRPGRTCAARRGDVFFF